MPKNNYNDGWQDGYWVGSGAAYDRGYEEGVQAERDRIKRAINGGSSVSEASTLGSMVGGSIILTIFGWCFAGLLLFLFWIGGCSGSWWFPWIWRIAFWGGVGFIVVMSIAGVVMTIFEQREVKNPPKKLINDQKLPRYDKYPSKEVFKARPVSDSSIPWQEEDSSVDVIEDQDKDKT